MGWSLVCAICGATFDSHIGTALVCSGECRLARKRRFSRSTDRQYDRITGNWRRYLNRLRAMHGREALDIDDLLTLLGKQEGRCALTGQIMTCILRRGERIWTNASIDRISPGQPYTIENIQLVCVAVNNWRSNHSIQEFISWCRLVAQHAETNDDAAARLQARVSELPREARAEEEPRPAKRRTARTRA